MPLRGRIASTLHVHMANLDQKNYVTLVYDQKFSPLSNTNHHKHCFQLESHSHALFLPDNCNNTRQCQVSTAEKYVHPTLLLKSLPFFKFQATNVKVITKYSFYTKVKSCRLHSPLRN